MKNLCKNCSKIKIAQTIGPAKKCGHITQNIVYAYCTECAKKKNRCQLCGKKLIERKKTMKNLCENCIEMMVVQAMGNAKKCGHKTTSISYAYCTECAKKKNRCQLCGKKLNN